MKNVLLSIYGLMVGVVVFVPALLLMKLTALLVGGGATATSLLDGANHKASEWRGRLTEW